MTFNQGTSLQNFGDYYQPGSGSSFFSGGSAPTFDWSKTKEIKNPFDLSISPYTVKGDYKFASGLGKTAFGGGESKSKPGWEKAFSLASSFLDKAKDKGEEDERMRNLPYALGRASQGFGGQVLDNLGVVMPNQHAPIVIPGVQQSGGGGSKSVGQRIAGGLGGAFQGFLAGAATGTPHMAGIGALAGGITGAMG